MMQVISTAVLEALVHVLIGVLLFEANEYMGYAYGVHIGWKYYQAFERMMSMKKLMKQLENGKK